AEEHAGLGAFEGRYGFLRGAHGRVLVPAVHVEPALAARVPLDRLRVLEAEGGGLDDGRGEGRVGALGRTRMHGDGGDLHAARSIASYLGVQAGHSGKEKAPGRHVRGLRKLKRLVPGWRGVPVARRANAS